MHHPDGVAPSNDAAPSIELSLCVVGAPVSRHRSYRLFSLGVEIMELRMPISMDEAATRIQLEIIASEPALISFESIRIEPMSDGRAFDVENERLVAYNAWLLPHRDTSIRLATLGGTAALQIKDVVASDADGATLVLRMWCAPFVPLGPGDPVMTSFAHPERGIRA